ncbi:MAG: bifunctional glutamate N-acetyltransferase/amino-acid acetyltransferase ArgJ [Bacteroidales bacterium]|nr:bifunctional glutamate N-acetyltransferase/amino-acid acetyltransferase ArgJ [Bacteroidales bacterium]
MIKNITSVRGISCWGAHIGIKASKRDLALIYSKVPAKVGAVFTKNVVLSECVKISKKHIADGIAQAIVVNSGNANTCTGEPGRLGAEAMAETMADKLKIKKEDVIVGSTGVIGRPFPTDIIVEGIKNNIPLLSREQYAGSLAASAILTTDTFTKEGYQSFFIGKKRINMAGFAKGSGMIHPNMGTMLAYIVCDVAIEQKLLQKTFLEAVNKSFNMISVDGDTSTNDMAFVLCNGLAGNREIDNENEKDYKTFKDKLEKLCLHLAKLIVSDGEGATKFIEYKVVGAPDYESARTIVRTISNSSLVKTAIFGRDPNWGRIIAAAGRAGVDFDPDKIDLFIGTRDNIQLLDKGMPTYVKLTKLKKMMRASKIHIKLCLNIGNASAVGWGSDLSEEYVRFNAAYTT